MISCKVVLIKGKGGDGEDWGSYDFLALPSPADRIHLDREGMENYATVLSVHHLPSPTGSGGKPTAEVVAKWTGAGKKIR